MLKLKTKIYIVLAGVSVNCTHERANEANAYEGRILFGEDEVFVASDFVKIDHTNKIRLNNMFIFLHLENQYANV